MFQANMHMSQIRGLVQSQPWEHETLNPGWLLHGPSVMSVLLGAW